MKCLFVNMNRGYGVELIGQLFIDILSRFDLFDIIDVWSSQCCTLTKEEKLQDYNIVFFNDPSGAISELNLINQLKSQKFKPYIFAISHGTLKNTHKYDAVFELNFEYINSLQTQIFNVFPLRFIPGNIWLNKQNQNKRKPLLFTGRIEPSKLPIDVVKYLYKRQQLDVYGPITNPEYYNNIKNMINYCGNVSHSELVDVYNNYTYFLMTSTTECLSMSLREALSCGLLPLVIDNCGYTNSITNYIMKFDHISELVNHLENNKKIKTNKNVLHFNKEFSFDKMILDFLVYLRGYLVVKNIKFNKNKVYSKINYLNQIDNRQSNYSYDIIDWNKLQI